AAIVPFAVYFLNPDRIPRDNLYDLEHGKSVTLIGETGPPRWSHWLVGEEVPIKPRARDGTFALSTAQYRLLELMPAMPGAGYRFRADIRHDEGINHGQLGLYFAHSRHGSGDAEEHTFCTLTFDDWVMDQPSRPIIGAYATIWAQHQPFAAAADTSFFLTIPQPAWPDRMAGMAKLTCRRCTSTADFTSETVMLVGRPFRTVAESGAGRSATWRRLAVEVRPEQIDVFWEDQHIGSVAVAQMDREFRLLNSMLAKQPKPLPPRLPLHPQFLPSQGVGLFLFSGGASFRRVVVEPL